MNNCANPMPRRASRIEPASPADGRSGQARRQDGAPVAQATMPPGLQSPAQPVYRIAPEPCIRSAVDTFAQPVSTSGRQAVLPPCPQADLQPDSRLHSQRDLQPDSQLNLQPNLQPDLQTNQQPILQPVARHPPSLLNHRSLHRRPATPVDLATGRALDLSCPAHRYRQPQEFPAPATNASRLSPPASGSPRPVPHRAGPIRRQPAAGNLRRRALASRAAEILRHYPPPPSWQRQCAGRFPLTAPPSGRPPVSLSSRRPAATAAQEYPAFAAASNWPVATAAGDGPASVLASATAPAKPETPATSVTTATSVKPALSGTPAASATRVTHATHATHGTHGTQGTHPPPAQAQRRGLLCEAIGLGSIDRVAEFACIDPDSLQHALADAMQTNNLPLARQIADAQVTVNIGRDARSRAAAACGPLPGSNVDIRHDYLAKPNAVWLRHSLECDSEAYFESLLEKPTDAVSLHALGFYTELAGHLARALENFRMVRQYQEGSEQWTTAEQRRLALAWHVGDAARHMAVDRTVRDGADAFTLMRAALRHEQILDLLSHRQDQTKLLLGLWQRKRRAACGDIPGYLCQQLYFDRQGGLSSPDLGQSIAHCESRGLSRPVAVLLAQSLKQALGAAGVDGTTRVCVACAGCPACAASVRARVQAVLSWLLPRQLNLLGELDAFDVSLVDGMLRDCARPAIALAWKNIAADPLSWLLQLQDGLLLRETVTCRQVVHVFITETGMPWTLATLLAQSWDDATGALCQGTFGRRMPVAALLGPPANDMTFRTLACLLYNALTAGMPTDNYLVTLPTVVANQTFEMHTRLIDAFKARGGSLQERAARTGKRRPAD
jgi:hypothetical protein